MRTLVTPVLQALNLLVGAYLALVDRVQMLGYFRQFLQQGYLLLLVSVLDLLNLAALGEPLVVERDVFLWRGCLGDLDVGRQLLGSAPDKGAPDPLLNKIGVTLLLL